MCAFGEAAQLARNSNRIASEYYRYNEPMARDSAWLFTMHDAVHVNPIVDIEAPLWRRLQCCSQSTDGTTIEHGQDTKPQLRDFLTNTYKTANSPFIFFSIENSQ